MAGVQALDDIAGGVAEAAPRRKWGLVPAGHDSGTAFWLMAPAIAVYGIFTLFPIAVTFWLSFTDSAGFNTPAFVVDCPGGGGKRDAHSYEHYDRTTGVSVYTSPAVHPGEYYCYFDPIDLLPPEGQRRWADPAEHQKMVDEALAAAKAHGGHR